MTIDEVVTAMQNANAYVPGKKVKIDLGGGGSIMLDGVSKSVTRDDGAADTTLQISQDDFIALLQRRLDPTAAFMQGKLKVQGDMGNAMQLQSIMPKV